MEKVRARISLPNDKHCPSCGADLLFQELVVRFRSATVEAVSGYIALDGTISPTWGRDYIDRVIDCGVPTGFTCPVCKQVIPLAEEGVSTAQQLEALEWALYQATVEAAVRQTDVNHYGGMKKRGRMSQLRYEGAVIGLEKYSRIRDSLAAVVKMFRGEDGEPHV